MLIKKVELENFLCYYNKKEFIFEDGLNLILGRNGEGKTKFFEALEWLLSISDKDDIIWVSEKKRREVNYDSTFPVSVIMTVEKYDETSVISKSFDVVISATGEISTTNFKFTVSKETPNGGRMLLDGKEALERIFPAHIRRYSMFKGEAELNIFDNKEALKKLIDAFSEIKHYPKYIELAERMNDWAQTSMDNIAKSNNKSSKKILNLQFEIEELKKKEKDLKKEIQDAEEERDNAYECLEKIEQNTERSGLLKTYNERISNKKNKIISLSNKINEEYSTMLLDEKWILLGMKDILNSFSTKVSNYSKTKRREEKLFIQEQTKEKIQNEIENDIAPLPWFIPNISTMQELLDDKICKVCNRPAPEGSEPYLFMEARLNEHLERNKKKKKDDLDNELELLFPNDYIDNLYKFEAALGSNDIRIESIKSEIAERLAFNRERKEDIKTAENELEKEIEEKARLMAETMESEEDLLSMHSKIKEWTKITKENSTLINSNQNNLNNILEILKDKEAEKNKINAQIVPEFQMNTFNILKDIKLSFIRTRERLLNEFVETLSNKANMFISQINIDDFTGRIRLLRDGEKITVQLVNSDGNIIHKPNGSLEISKHMAVLFGISELATETEDESFPMIFDAPTSSFDMAKVQDFYNLIYNTKKQRIIATMDFTSMDDERNPIVDSTRLDKIKKDKVYWISRERPFIKEDLSTIETQVKPYPYE